MKRCWVVMLCAAAGLGGCAEAQSEGEARPKRMGGASRARFPAATSNRVFEAARQALAQWFPNVEARPGEGRLVAMPVEYDQKGGTERLGDVVGPRHRMRRSGVIEVRSLGQGAEAQCLIDIEKLDTAEHRAMYRDQTRFEDAPTDTPIDRDAGLTAQQQQVWTALRRDRGLEREILDVIRSRVEGGSSAPHGDEGAGRDSREGGARTDSRTSGTSARHE